MGLIAKQAQQSVLIIQATPRISDQAVASETEDTTGFRSNILIP
jgi:hypothetical protein